ncbi:MAG: TIGR01459 family HAD-type hydrolase [Pseudomonadota bacterium]
METPASLDAIADRYDAVLCDVWGVIHNGRQIYPRAAAALHRFRAEGKIVLLVSNVPKPRDPIPGQLDRLGFPRDAWSGIVTSGDAIRAELAKRAPGPTYKIGPENDRSLWAGLGLEFASLEAARFIGISGLNDEHETPADYADVLAAAKARDLELLCANPDIVVQFGDRLLWCAGAVAREYEAIGGRVVMAGKPFAPIYYLAFSEIEDITGRPVDESRVLAIGDGVGTDVKGANAQGIDCLFIAAGVHGDALMTGGAVDVAKAEAALAAEGVTARYVMRELA